MRIDRKALVCGAQLVLLLPSTGLALMALTAGTAGVLGGIAAATGLFRSTIELDPQQSSSLSVVYLYYILLSVGLFLVPALGYGLLVLLIIKGATWLAARRWLAIVTLIVGAAACVIAGWLAFGIVAEERERFSTFGASSFITTATLVMPLLIGVFNMALLAAALVRRPAAL